MSKDIERNTTMLIGTFQSFPRDENNKYCNPISAKRKFYSELGFAPVWGFPIDSLEDFFAQSICVVPNFPEIFYIIETDNFIKLDKVRWLRDKMKDNDNAKKNIHNYIDPNLSNEYSELLLNPNDIFKEGNQIKVIVNILAIKDFIEGKCDLKTVMLEVDCFPEDAILHIKKRMTEIWNLLKEPVIEKGSLTLAEFEAQKTSFKCKQVFSLVLLPFIYNFAKQRAAYPFMTEIFSRNIMQVSRLSQKLSDWIKNDCSQSEYVEIYNKLKETAITDENVLAALASECKIERNEACPCGSGKKWKKCHGKLIVG